MAMEEIRIGGARQHNLKNVSLILPRNQLVVFTGVSGSGKSSLAFDTLYAEGQRRYVESLSTYARQYLEQMESPTSISSRASRPPSPSSSAPRAAIPARPSPPRPRSTISLRLLFAHLGQPHHPVTGKPLRQLVGAADGRSRAGREGRDAGANSRAGHS